jgi:hypothetical protein
MSKASRNQQHFFIFFGKKESLPLTESWRLLPQIYYNIIDRACSHSDELCLRLSGLKMQPTKDSLLALRMIVLDEVCRDSDFFKFCSRVCLHKKSPSVSEDLRFNDVAVGERCWNFSERHNYFIRFIRYCPYPFFIIGFARSRI